MPIIDEATMLEMLESSNKAFLIEPKYQTRYLPLGLARIATFLKSRGIEYEFGRHYDGQECDLICITSLFTYQSEKVFNAITESLFLANGTKILVGGIFASLMPYEILKRFPGVFIFRGCSHVLDRCVPDYSIRELDDVWSTFSFLFTTRGCPNRCPYCAVWKIEPEFYINETWRDMIMPDRPSVIIMDNNLSSWPLEHLKNVVDYINEHNKDVVLGGGFDVKYITTPMAETLAELTYTHLRTGMRVAFDRIEEDGIFQTGVKKLISAGIPPSYIMAYCLFNFKDTPDEANYRVRECAKLGIRPYPLRYEPLNKLSRKKRHVGKHWTEDLCREFEIFGLNSGFYKYQDFQDWLQERKNQCIVNEQQELLPYFQTDPLLTTQN